MRLTAIALIVKFSKFCNASSKFSTLHWLSKFHRLSWQNWDCFNLQISRISTNSSYFFFLEINIVKTYSEDFSFPSLNQYIIFGLLVIEQKIFLLTNFLYLQIFTEVSWFGPCTNCFMDGVVETMNMSTWETHSYKRDLVRRYTPSVWNNDYSLIPGVPKK